MDFDKTYAAAFNARTKKLTKAELWHEFRAIVESLDDEHAPAMIDILRWFAPPVPKKPKSPEQWAATFTCNDDPKFELNYMKCEDGLLIATDGYTLCAAETKLPSGYYCAKTMEKLNEEDDILRRFPQWQRVLPSETTPVDIPSDPETRTDAENIVRIKIGDHWYNQRLVNRLMAFNPDGDGVFSVGEDSGILQFESCYGRALTLPMRM